MEIQEKNTLKKELSNRHIQLIALGGAIGTGLFLGLSQTIKLAGPSVLLGYALAGVIAFLIMRQLGEMVVHEPVSGSFSYFANKYLGKIAGFMSGWNYWVLYVLVSMAELSAIGTFVQFWWPEIPTWLTALFFFILINGINLINVKFFGESEFLFSMIKIVAILSMIGFGAYLLLSGNAGPQASVSNLWQFGGFFPNGAHGFIMAMAVIMFAFGGLELIGITAAETKNPQKTIPKAVNQIVYRVLIFYVGAIGILLCLYPWNQVAQGGSPFVLIFQSLNSGGVANVLNFVVLIAAISVYNSCIYCNTRMLHGLAEQGNAPKFLKKVNKRGIPVNAVLLSSAVTALCVLINYIMPSKAFELLMMLVVSALVINWLMISITHLKFRKVMLSTGEQTSFKSLYAPWSNYLTIGFVFFILIVMSFTPDMRIAVVMIPVWLVFLSVMYMAKYRKKAPIMPEVGISR
ncbi:amino acid permease [Acinetobacter gerneri]|uniref:Amino acid permease n=1 Tax=Acinetobacter gerneri TaxID=202952 RepID=A0AAW8JI96_9GAMM|nr:amino acid permease [Acinetobacter gerneri]MDQ9010024.1 amino acid permease [Acinetobacter gerneri]MDQ9014054.1 amino acid permease [Acinetobacter gerneri]MDQ9025334.1 amino acid permease [Acinetobacter gerneri]MDQ9052613.1 amino acid permease [Acinetobacter gerneri]MDQ9060094.1 amino acid permease [Acinetobacter gerneri]